MKKFFALLLSICLICSLGVTAFAADGDIVILHTNDVHTYIDETLTYAHVAQMKEDFDAILVDAGDHLQGTAYGAMDNGATIVELMSAAGYDVATLGNHEFDYGMARALEVATSGEAAYTYVSCNFIDLATNKSVLDSYKIVEKGGKKIAFVGITTPETYTKSAPAYFQDGNGNWIYSILGAGTSTTEDLYAAVQASIDAAKADGADYVIALGHLGVDETSAPWRSTDVIANVSGLTAFIDGHSHTQITLNNMVQGKDGNDVLLAQTGDYLKAVGKITIAADGTVSNELVTGYEALDADVDAIAKNWIAEVDGMLNVKIAETDIEFTINDSEGKRLIRVDETNLGNLSPDAYYYYINMVENLDCDVAIMNGGGIRATIAAGDWSYNSAKTVHPFGNVLCLMEVPGQVILDALEWGAKSTTFTAGSNENGGFLHVAGITYEIDTTIASTVQIDEAGLWAGAPTGEYRVKNIQVYNKATGEFEALDTEKTYRLAGTNYTLRSCGDGFNMFGDAVLVKDYIAEDYLALSAYIMAFEDSDGNGYANIASCNSPLVKYAGYPLNYENSLGSGRILELGTEHDHQPDFCDKYHWEACECGHIINREEHDLVWVVDEKAADGHDGYGHYECECGYKSESVVIPFTGTLPRPSVDDVPGKADDESNPNTGAPVFGFAAIIALAGLVMRRK